MINTPAPDPVWITPYTRIYHRGDTPDGSSCPEALTYGAVMPSWITTKKYVSACELCFPRKREEA